MKYSEIFKSRFLAGFESNLSTVGIILTLAVALVAGLYIFAVYRYKTRSSLYSKDFNNSLAILPVITAAILLSMQRSIVISLGMVGALSIVRFRNRVKSSLDLTFLFWAISRGIIIGAGVWELAVILCAVVTVLTLGLDLLPARKSPWLLVVNRESSVSFEKDIQPVVKENGGSCRLKSVTLSQNYTDIIREVRAEKADGITRRLAALPGVERVNMLRNDGDERIGG